MKPSMRIIIPPKFQLPAMLALGIRLIRIVSRPIWYDEAFAILFSEKGLSAMLYGTLTSTGAGAADIHPLGYYSILWGWMTIFGNSLIAARLLSILSGVVTILVAHRLTKDLFGARIANLAGIFLALAPFQVHYSQEIRMYSFLALWLMSATYAYRRGSKGGSWMWWFAFSIFSALAQYTHNLAAFYLITLAAWPILRRDWKTFRAVTLAGLGALLLYLPWLIHLPSQLAKVSDAYWVDRPGIGTIFTLLLVYVTNLPLPDGWLFIALFIAMAATIIALLQTVKRSNRNLEAMWLLYLAFTPPLLLFITSQWIPVYIERALLPSGVAFCLWLAWALFGTSLPKALKSLLTGLLILGAVVGLYQHVTYRGFPYAPYRELDASLRDRIEMGDRIVHASKATRLPMAYYDSALPQEYIADPSGGNTDTLAAATQKVLGLIAQPDLTSATRATRRVWLIVLQHHIDAYIQLGYSNHPYLLKLEETYHLQNIETWGDVRVYIFIKKPK
jgi:mannosyltransferase